jgi:hypothetical protein
MLVRDLECVEEEPYMVVFGGNVYILDLQYNSSALMKVGHEAWKAY